MLVQIEDSNLTMESFVVVVENHVPDVENQLDHIKTYLEDNKDNLQNQTGIKAHYYKVIQAGYNVFSKLPIENIKPAVFRVFLGTFNKLATV